MFRKSTPQPSAAKSIYIHDRQHAEINRAHKDARAAIIEGRGMDRIVATSKELIGTTLEHFNSEEIAMDAVRGDFSTHKRIHAELIENLKDISAELEHRKIASAMKLMKFFEERVAYHLDVEDAEMERELSRTGSNTGKK